MTEDIIRDKASHILQSILCDGTEIDIPDDYADFFRGTSCTGERDGYSDMFSVNALRSIISGDSPSEPYDRKDFEDMLVSAREDNNASLREWLHSNRERARFLHMAQREYGPIFDGSELMLVAYCLEERETFHAVKEKLNLMLM